MAHVISCKSQIAVLEMNGQSVPQRWTSMREGLNTAQRQCSANVARGTSSCHIAVYYKIREITAALAYVICTVAHGAICAKSIYYLWPAIINIFYIGVPDGPPYI